MAYEKVTPFRHFLQSFVCLRKQHIISEYVFFMISALVVSFHNSQRAVVQSRKASHLEYLVNGAVIDVDSIAIVNRKPVFIWLAILSFLWLECMLWVVVACICSFFWCNITDKRGLLLMSRILHTGFSVNFSTAVFCIIVD